jgi:hypothetical protein
MPATVIAERIGWPHSIRTLSGRVAELRPAYLPPDPASRTVYAAGEIGQCDFWFPPVRLPVGFGQHPGAEAAAGADDSDRVCAVGLGAAAALAAGGGSVRGLVASDRRAGRGAAAGSRAVASCVISVRAAAVVVPVC